MADLTKILLRQRRLQERNDSASWALRDMTRSRDEWREKAIARGEENKRLRAKIARRVLPTSTYRKRHYSAEKWRQHDLIVARIRAIPDREA